MEAHWAHKPGSNPGPALPLGLRLHVCETEGTWSLGTAKVQGEDAGAVWALCLHPARARWEGVSPWSVSPQCHLGTVLRRSLFTDWGKEAGLQRRQCTLAKEATGEEWGCGGRGGCGGHLVLCAHHQHREPTQQPLEEIGPPHLPQSSPGVLCTPATLTAHAGTRRHSAQAAVGLNQPRQAPGTRSASLLLHEGGRSRRADEMPRGGGGSFKAIGPNQPTSRGDENAL